MLHDYQKQVSLFTAEFDDGSGKIVLKEFECYNLEDATIEATNYAESELLEFLSVYYKNSQICRTLRSK